MNPCRAKVTPYNTPSAVWTGSEYLDLLDPDPAAIRLWDIASALSRQVRFNGLGTCVPWTVAQHSLLCLDFAEQDGLEDPLMRLLILLHDAPEAYLGDMVRPLKRVLPSYADLEARMWAAVCGRFGLRPSPEARQLVAHYDMLALASEKAALISKRAGDWPGLPEPREISPEKFAAHPSEVACDFLHRSETLLSRLHSATA